MLHLPVFSKYYTILTKTLGPNRTTRHNPPNSPPPHPPNPPRPNLPRPPHPHRLHSLPRPRARRHPLNTNRLHPRDPPPPHRPKRRVHLPSNPSKSPPSIRKSNFSPTPLRLPPNRRRHRATPANDPAQHSRDICKIVRRDPRAVPPERGHVVPGHVVLRKAFHGAVFAEASRQSLPFPLQQWLSRW